MFIFYVISRFEAQTELLSNGELFLLSRGKSADRTDMARGKLISVFFENGIMKF